MDEERGSSSGRHPILSINEVLRDGKLTRDKNKVRKRDRLAGNVHT